MKTLISTILLISSTALFGQSDTMRKMASTIIESKGYLIPNEPNNFKVPKGTRVKFTLYVLNEGNEGYTLNKDKFLTATYLDKAKETNFNIKIEPFKQAKMLETQIQALITRKDKAQNLLNDQAAKYGKMLYGNEGVKDKIQLLKHLENKINSLKKAKEAAAQFDKDRTVAPGAQLTFSASGFLPETGKEKPQSYVNLNVKVISSDGKYISVPVKAIFF